VIDMSEYMTKKECAAFMRVSVSAVDVLRKEQMLPFIQLGKRILFDKEQVAKYLSKLQIVNK
jgi:excisionase family DNA binding protein